MVTVVAQIILLCIRGVLLWLVIPLATVWWFLVMPVRMALGRPYLSPAKVIGWADLNLLACLGMAVGFTAWSGVETVDHRVRLTDPS